MVFGTLVSLLSLCHFVITPGLSTATTSAQQNFSKCISYNVQQYSGTSYIIFASNSPDYSATYTAYIREPRFLNSTNSNPDFIVVATSVSHIQGAIICARRSGLQVRIRSGGHDYEGLSYRAGVPFILIDLFNLRSVDVDIGTESAWVETGATLGDLYYNIAEKSQVYGFPAGTCSTVGVGGHLSGGGFGFIFRKYGLAADNILDAKIVDANGRVLTRATMGENLFWAIRGGGGANFGVIVSFKVRIVPVPRIVTMFSIAYTLEQGGARLLQKWQDIARKYDDDFFLRVVLTVSDSSASPLGGNQTVSVSFQSLYLGGVDKLLWLLQRSFPELNVRRENCTEMTYIQSVLSLAGFPINGSTSVLMNRTTQDTAPTKMKSDYVTISRPIPETGFEGLFRLLVEKSPYVILTPYGGIMARIPESETPYPHRGGINYAIQYGVSWNDETEAAETLNYMRKLYKYMEAYVSMKPRQAYLQYRDLDLGTNGIDGIANYREASVWGFKYFQNNFLRLARTKTEVDPGNFFRNEQSVPVLSHTTENYDECCAKLS